MENILPRREARENAFLLAFSQTFGDVPLQEALDTNNECGEERPVDVFGQRLLSAITATLQRWMTSSVTICATGPWSACPVSA